MASLSFQLPVCAVTLKLAGADVSETLTLFGSTAVLMLIVSRPFGLFLEATRRLAGVEDHQIQNRRL